MNMQRLEKKIESLKKENAELKEENKRLKKALDDVWEKEIVLDHTQAEYNDMIADLKSCKEQYKKLIDNLRYYDSKVMNKYKKDIKHIVKESVV